MRVDACIRNKDSAENLGDPFYPEQKVGGGDRQPHPALLQVALKMRQGSRRVDVRVDWCEIGQKKTKRARVRSEQTLHISRRRGRNDLISLERGSSVLKLRNMTPIDRRPTMSNELCHILLRETQSVRIPSSFDASRRGCGRRDWPIRIHLLTGRGEDLYLQSQLGLHCFSKRLPPGIVNLHSRQGCSRLW